MLAVDGDAHGPLWWWWWWSEEEVRSKAKTPFRCLRLEGCPPPFSTPPPTPRAPHGRPDSRGPWRNRLGGEDVNRALMAHVADQMLARGRAPAAARVGESGGGASTDSSAFPPSDAGMCPAYAPTVDAPR